MQAVKMYTTAVCPYCIRAKQILKSKGVEQIEEVRIDTDPQARAHMMEITQRRTVPQIFIGDTHVGGCDDLHALDGRGLGLDDRRGLNRSSGNLEHHQSGGDHGDVLVLFQRWGKRIRLESGQPLPLPSGWAKGNIACWVKESDQ